MEDSKETTLHIPSLYLAMKNDRSTRPCLRDETPYKTEQFCEGSKATGGMTTLTTSPCVKYSTIRQAKCISVREKGGIAGGVAVAALVLLGLLTFFIRRNSVAKCSGPGAAGFNVTDSDNAYKVASPKLG